MRNLEKERDGTVKVEILCTDRKTGREGVLIGSFK